MDENKKILVTGGCGFIGSEFIRQQLTYTKNVVFNIDFLTYAANEDNIKEFKEHPFYDFQKIDICNFDALDNIFKVFLPDYVVNFAAESHVDNSIMSCKEFLRTNIDGTVVLLELSRKYKIEKFIQISTDEVYGALSEKDDLKKETDLLKPGNPYSASKASAEMMCFSYHNTYKVPVIITRSSNNYGYYQYKEKFLPLFITNLIQNKKVPLYGNGRNIRDWTHVFDNVRAINLVVEKGNIGEVYNISSNYEIRNIDVCNLLLDLMNRDELYIEYVDDRLGHDWRYSIDSTKIRALGWRPKIDFKDGLKNTIKWYKENEWFWRKQDAQ